MLFLSRRVMVISASSATESYAPASSHGGPIITAEAPRRNLAADYPLGSVRLHQLMTLSVGIEDVAIGLVDGPVDSDQDCFARERIDHIPPSIPCTSTGPACAHGTFVAGVLSGRRGVGVPAICPGCHLLVRPVFEETAPNVVPHARPRELAKAIVECIGAGARLVNISSSVRLGGGDGSQALQQSLDHACQRGVVVIAAAGNQPTVGGSILTRHPWVVSVAAFSRSGRPLQASTLSRSGGLRGLGAPGEDIASFAPGGRLTQSSGSSAATPFVTGTAALIWSLFPKAPGAAVRHALTRAAGAKRRGIVPPMLDASAAHFHLQSIVER